MSEVVHGEIIKSREARPGDEIWMENRWHQVGRDEFDEDDTEPVLRRVRVPVDTERERLRPHGTQQRNPWKGS